MRAYVARTGQTGGASNNKGKMVYLPFLVVLARNLSRKSRFFSKDFRKKFPLEERKKEGFPKKLVGKPHQKGLIPPIQRGIILFEWC